MDYKLMVANKIAQASGLDADKIYALMEIPPRSDMGDFAFPCYTLAK